MINYRTKTAQLVRCAVIGALYAALTILLSPISYGPLQLRLSEMMTVLPVLSGASVWGLTAGCLISNLLSPYGWLDMLFGTAATLIAALLSRALRRVTVKGMPLLSFIMPVVCNALIVGAEITLFSESAGLPLYLWSALTVGAGEAVVCLGFGIPFWLLASRTGLKRYL